ncbi:hypothetical protein SEA_SATIS_254 [Streptomyces phage Satis]|nr:hypothetical protein SEA_SATIS_254 [Streptomyces phage Satis]QBZ72141.1 hypothetical protein SEA_KRADAL_255 [Streptomyces phage Kradal]QPL14562.1 hypothetical protein SEA_EHYELIMAYOE_257 [Streptomyces phage EhyElimayoE]
MKSSLLTYDHPYTGTTSVLVEVPGLPVTIKVVEHRGARVSAELVPMGANTVQLGPDDPHGTGVKVRAVNESESGVRRTMTSILPGAVFSQTASVSGGTTIQCGGSLNMGTSRKPGAVITVPSGSFLKMREHGPVTVEHGTRVLSLAEAAEEGLFDVE